MTRAERSIQDEQKIGVSPRSGALEPAHILIVDDRADKRLALQAAVSELKENVVVADSGKEALRCLLRQDFAVILLDVNMPGMDGFETAALIRQRTRSELTPIIFVSALNDEDNHVSRGYSLGAVDYILTPIVPEILRAKVSVFVDLFRKTAQIKRQAEERTDFIRAEAARVEAEAARERSAFLAEASNVLAGSLEYEQTFAALARLTVPKLADYCLVDLLESDGTLRQVAVAHRDSLLEPDLLQLHGGVAVDPNTPYGVRQVMRTGEPEMCASVDAEKLQRFCEDYHPALCEEGLAFRSYLIIPLRARGKLLGAITLANAEERTYTYAELTLAKELAQRAGLALDNAGLYTAAQTARQEAERANRAKDEFLAMLSHELRTPLSPVLATVALLESDPETPPSVRDALQMIHRNVTLEARLIDDLLDLTRVSKGKIQLNFENVDAHALLNSAIDICRTEIDEKQLQITIHLDATRTFIRADSARLQQIFWNLIKNSVKFTPAHGGLTLSTSNDGGKLCVEIIDTGAGIDSEVLPKIFNAFEQGTRPKSGGLGLGLAITRALVDMHGGEIVARSGGADQGSTFVVCFETEEAAENTEIDGAASAGKAAERLSLRLLLVEDHHDTQQTLSRLLERRGYEVRVADCLQLALAVASEYKFDVLISDMGLPDGSGLELMTKLSRNGPVRGIALSGYGMEEDVQRSRSVGYAEHLTKPVDIQKLDAAIQQIGRG